MMIQIFLNHHTFDTQTEEKMYPWKVKPLVFLCKLFFLYTIIQIQHIPNILNNNYSDAANKKWIFLRLIYECIIANS